MIASILNKLNFNDLRIIRYATGATLAMAIAMAIDWPLAFLTPVLALSFLASPKPRPTFKAGIVILAVIATACIVALLVSRLFLQYPFIYIPFIGLLLFHLYYAKGGSVHPGIILALLITLLLIPMIVLLSEALANTIALNILFSAFATLIVVWIAYAFFPDPIDAQTGEPGKAPPAAKPPTLHERFVTATEITLVVLPLLTVFYIFQLTGVLLVLIFVALLSMQPGFADDFKAGKALILGNVMGGVAAIIVYELLVMVPEFLFLILITLLVGLFFGARLFSDKPAAPLFGMAFSTFVLVIGSTTGSNAEAESKVYTRIFQIMMAVIYVVSAFGLLHHFKEIRKQKKLQRQMKLAGKTTLLLGLLLLTSNCTMGPNYTRPEMPETETYRDQVEMPSGESVANLPWWELFGDTVLQNLISESLAENRNLRTALARIDESRANLGIVRADLYPRVNYGAAGSIDNTFGDNDETTSSGSVAIDASYQVDLWGRIRRANEAAFQQLLSTEEAYRGITITLVAEVANAYLLLRDLDNRLYVSERTAEARKHSLEIIETKYRAGIVSEVDVNQAEIQYADAEASVQIFKRLRAQTENAISVLLGKPPMTISRGLPLSDQQVSPEIPIGLPSDLLDRRPDLLEAERLLHAQTARIGVAEALKYPQLNLTADLGAQFSSVTNAFLGLGAQLFGPLFNSGENQRRVEVEIARTEQLLNQYEQTFFTALREVEDALVAVETYEAEYQIRNQQMEAAESAAELSWVRYEGGLTSYLEVLDLERSLFTAQLKTSEALQLRLTSTVDLYRALGGGWIPAQDSLGVEGSQ